MSAPWKLPERAAAASLCSAMSCVRSTHVSSVAAVRHESERNSDWGQKVAESFQQLNAEIIAILTTVASLENWDKLTQKT